MTSAYLLDKTHEVTLFERSATLGGHAHTTTVQHDGRDWHADDGFAWFTDGLYPRFMRLLEIHDVPTRIVPMRWTFADTRRADALVLPPAGVAGLFRSLTAGHHRRALWRIDRAIRLGAPLVAQRNCEPSWGEFLRQHGLDDDLGRELLTPIVAGGWGGPYGRAHEFSAYAMLKYVVLNRPSSLAPFRWHVLRDGAASYIETVARRLQTTVVLRGTGISLMERNPDGFVLTDTSGVKRCFDQVVLATGSHEARALASGLTGFDAVNRVLSRFETYTTRVATHGDSSVMPPVRKQWSVANLRWDGSASRMTIWVGHDGNAPVFTTAIGDQEPSFVHNISTFRLPFVSPEHHRAQSALTALQGQGGLWFAGDWTCDIGSHKNAVQSALLVGNQLAPDSRSLVSLMEPRHHPPFVALPGDGLRVAA